jgi:hypothetical protein
VTSHKPPDRHHPPTHPQYTLCRLVVLGGLAVTTAH